MCKFERGRKVEHLTGCEKTHPAGLLLRLPCCNLNICSARTGQNQAGEAIILTPGPDRNKISWC